jgi:hypothetical protein
MVRQDVNKAPAHAAQNGKAKDRQRSEIPPAQRYRDEIQNKKDDKQNQKRQWTEKKKEFGERELWQCLCGVKLHMKIIAQFTFSFHAEI